MKIMNVVRKATLPIAVIGAVGLNGCEGNVRQNMQFVKNSGISANAWDSLTNKNGYNNFKGGLAETSENWQKLADSLKWQAKLDSTKKFVIDSMTTLYNTAKVAEKIK